MRRVWTRLWGEVERYSLAALAFLWRTLLFRTKFIAVTGSFGKTTAKDFLAAMLARLGPTVKTDGNRNGTIGISQAILRTRPWHRFVVMEIGTDRKGFMVRGSLLVRPDVVLILRVARRTPRSSGRWRPPLPRKRNC